MTKEIYGIFTPQTFRRLNDETVVYENLQHLTYMLDMIFKGFAEYQNVVDIDDNKRKFAE